MEKQFFFIKIQKCFIFFPNFYFGVGTYFIDRIFYKQNIWNKDISLQKMVKNDSTFRSRGFLAPKYVMLWTFMDKEFPTQRRLLTVTEMLFRFLKWLKSIKSFL